MLDALARARLVTADDAAAQVTHEALIREWPELREWLRDNREALRLERQLAAAAREWHEGGRDASYLYDGAQLAAAQEWAGSPGANLTGTVRDFLDAATGEELLRLTHEGQVTQATWNGDWSRILTASEDGKARVWDAATGEELFTLAGDGTAVNDARWNGDESQILIATSGGQAIAYYTRMEDLIAAACGRLGRNLTWAEWQQYFSGESYRQTCPSLPIHDTVPEEERP